MTKALDVAVAANAMMIACRLFIVAYVVLIVVDLLQMCLSMTAFRNFYEGIWGRGYRTIR